LISGTLSFFQFQALEGSDPDYVTYWKRIKSEPEEKNSYTDIADGLELIKTGPSVLYVSLNILKGFVK